MKHDAIELVLCDMDGTLLKPDHSISPRNLAAVKALQAAGVHFTLATGRPPKGMRDQVKQLGIELPTAAFNGGVLMNANGTCLQSHRLPLEAVHTTLKVLAPHKDVEVWVFSGDEWLLRDPHRPMVAREQNSLGYAPRVVQDFEPFSRRVDKIVATCSNVSLLAGLELQLQDALKGLASASRSQAHYLDVTAPQANKGHALFTLAGLLKVPLERTMVIGDGGNDLAMFQRAGISVAMGQASDEVRQQAMQVTGSNVDDGVAQAIERYVLQPLRGF